MNNLSFKKSNLKVFKSELMINFPIFDSMHGFIVNMFFESWYCYIKCWIKGFKIILREFLEEPIFCPNLINCLMKCVWWIWLDIVWIVLTLGCIMVIYSYPFLIMMNCWKTDKGWSWFVWSISWSKLFWFLLNCSCVVWSTNRGGV